MILKVKLDDGAIMPKYAHAADAGMDLFCRENTVISGGCSALFDTGVHLAIPYGFYGKIASKSGLCVKHDIVSEAGIIDSGYTGSIAVKLRNNSDVPYVFRAGDKIAQLIIMPCENPALIQVDELEDTERGSGGFGSTGR